MWVCDIVYNTAGAGLHTLHSAHENGWSPMTSQTVLNNLFLIYLGTYII